MKTFIYILRDPNTLQIKYVGKSDNPYERTFGINNCGLWLSHIEEAKTSNKYTYKLNWIRSLLKNNQLPILSIIDEVPKNNWQWYEMQNIKLLKDIGCKLTNKTEGGDGFKGKHSEETKRKIGNASKGNKNTLGMKHSEETKRKISKSNIGRIVSEEHKKNLSLVLKGKIKTKEHCKNIGLSKKGQIPYNKGKVIKYQLRTRSCQIWFTKKYKKLSYFKPNIEAKEYLKGLL